LKRCSFVGFIDSRFPIPKADLQSLPECMFGTELLFGTKMFVPSYMQ
jgi:hypothetical protein